MPHRGRDGGVRVGRGNGAEWDEEYRWDIDGTSSPMEGCLVVQLNARVGPTNTTAATAATMKRRRQQDEGNLSGGGGDGSSANTSISTEQQPLGLRGLWRKGREQLEERRRVSSVLEQQHQQLNIPTQHSQHGGTAREQSAATVAQYLMSRQDSTGMETTATTATSDNVVDSSLINTTTNDVVDDDENDSSNSALPSGGGGGGGGLCLGTLTIPLSRLPLEEAFLGKDAAIAKPKKDSWIFD